MKKIYFAHSSEINYEKNYYAVIENAHWQRNIEFIFPMRAFKNMEGAKPALLSCDCLVADVSKSSTGLGIEIGLAHMSEIPIFAIYHKDAVVSDALEGIVTCTFAYNEIREAIDWVNQIVDMKKIP